MTDAKIIKHKFFNALKRGTGEAYFLAKQHPEIDFSQYIIKGALNNYEYDGQAEDSRAQYIYDIISVVPQKSKIRNAIIKGLKTEKKGTWSLTHLFDLNKIYALQGDLEAKQAIYDRFFHNIINGADWVGYREILELDGLKGLIYIADKIGRYLVKNPEDYQDDLIINDFQNKNPEINVIGELENASKSNKYIKIYIDNIKRTEQSRNEYHRPAFSFQLLKDKIESNEKASLYLFEREIAILTDKDINELADDFLTEKNRIKIEKYLRVFSQIKFPYSYQSILKFAKQKPKSNDRIVEFAINALEYLNADEIREFAIEKLTGSKSPYKYVRLLINNYKDGDASLLKLIAEKAKSEHVIESLASDYSDIYSKNLTKECAEPLINLYNKMNCGIHRKSIIKILIENDVLPSYINKEIQFDSYLPTRELHKLNN